MGARLASETGRSEGLTGSPQVSEDGEDSTPAAACGDRVAGGGRRGGREGRRALRPRGSPTLDSCELGRHLRGAQHPLNLRHPPVLWKSTAAVPLSFDTQQSARNTQIGDREPVLPGPGGPWRARGFGTSPLARLAVRGGRGGAALVTKLSVWGRTGHLVLTLARGVWTWIERPFPTALVQNTSEPGEEA